MSLNSQPIPSTSVDLLSQAKTAARQSNMADVIDLCQQGLALTPLEDTLLDDFYKLYVEALLSLYLFDEALAQVTLWMERTQRNVGRVDALTTRSRILMRKGDIGEAVSVIDEAISLAMARGVPRGLAASSRQRADILWSRGDAEEALILLRQAQGIYESVNDVEGQIDTLISIGIAYHVMGQFYLAIQINQKAERLCQSVGDLAGLAIIYNNLGEAYQQLYAMERALFYHQKAFALLNQPPDIDLIRNIGVDLVAVGRVEEGLNELYHALEVARQGDKDAELQALYSLADALYNSNRVSEAKSLALDLLKEARQIQSERHISRAALILGFCARAEDDLMQAQEYFNESFMLAQQTADRSTIWQTHAALADMLAASQPALARVHRTIAADMVNAIALSIEDRELRAIFKDAPPVSRLLQSTEPEDE